MFSQTCDARLMKLFRSQSLRSVMCTISLSYFRFAKCIICMCQVLEVCLVYGVTKVVPSGISAFSDIINLDLPSVVRN